MGGDREVLFSEDYALINPPKSVAYGSRNDVLGHKQTISGEYIGGSTRLQVNGPIVKPAPPPRSIIHWQLNVSRIQETGEL